MQGREPWERGWRFTWNPPLFFFFQYNFIEHTHVQLTFTKDNLQQNKNYNLKLMLGISWVSLRRTPLEPALTVCLRLHANGRNNSQHCWDLQCIVERIQPISLCKPCVMSVRGPNSVGRAVQTDPTLLRYASAITKQKKCWELLAEKFDWFQTLRNKTQQHPATCNIQQCCVRLHGALRKI